VLQPLIRLKPTASRAVHLLTVALLWSVVGAALLAVGLGLLRTLAPIPLAVVLALAIVVGAIKTRFVLRRTADRVIDRIRARGDGRCLGGVLSWRMWLFVVAMIALGRLLRVSPLAAEIVGAVYVAVGVALVLGSLRFWGAWRTDTV